MKNYYFIVLILCLVAPILQAQTQDYYIGWYCLESSHNSSEVIEFEICMDKSQIGFEQIYTIYKSITNKNLNLNDPTYRLDDVVEIDVEMEIGYCYISDSSLILFSYKDNLREYEFKILDSLNMEVVYSKKTYLQIGDMIHRMCRYFPQHQCGSYLSKDFDCKWFIEQDIDSATLQYHCYYMSEPQGYFFFNYDSITILPPSIYKNRNKSKTIH